MTMINDLASATEAELGALFVNYQRGTSACMEFIEMCHIPPPTPEVT